MTKTQVLQIISNRLQEILETNPSYGDIEEDLFILKGKKDLAEELLELIQPTKTKTKWTDEDYETLREVYERWHPASFRPYVSKEELNKALTQAKTLGKACLMLENALRFCTTQPFWNSLKNGSKWHLKNLLTNNKLFEYSDKWEEMNQLAEVEEYALDNGLDFEEEIPEETRNQNLELIREKLKGLL